MCKKRISIFLLMFIWVVLSSGWARAGENGTNSLKQVPPPAEWHKVLDNLDRIDRILARGNRRKAVRVLARSRDSWAPPFFSVASDYMEILKSGKPLVLDSPGVALLASELKELEDNALRTELEEKILNMKPRRRDANAAILLDRGNRAFYAKRVKEALTVYQLLVNEYPRSYCRGEALYNLGIAQANLKQYDTALNSFKRLLKLDVDNRREYANSIMDMGYKNYHHRAAVNAAYCLEKLGRYNEAYHYLQMASTIYPFHSWCGHCAHRQRMAIDNYKDYVAFAGGGWLVVRHVIYIIGCLWYAWAMLLAWLLFAAWVARKSPIKWQLRIYTSAAAAFVITLVCWALNMDGSLRFISSILLNNGYFTDGYLWRYLVPAAGLLLALVIRKYHRLAARLLATASVTAAATAHIIFIPGHIHDLHLPCLPVVDIQFISFTSLLFPATVVISACTALVTLLPRMKTRNRPQRM